MTAPQSADKTHTDEMVDRFLGWTLPADFHPDCGISFTPPKTPHPVGYWPTGTNLFTADQAKAMLEHVTGPLQAKLDRLMLEHCPEEMTEAQMANWAKHQKPVSPEEEAAVDAAIGLTTRTAVEDIERRMVDMIRYIGVKAGVPEATYGAMCHEARSILRNAHLDYESETRSAATDRSDIEVVGIFVQREGKWIEIEDRDQDNEPDACFLYRETVPTAGER